MKKIVTLTLLTMLLNANQKVEISKECTLIIPDRFVQKKAIDEELYRFKSLKEVIYIFKLKKDDYEKVKKTFMTQEKGIKKALKEEGKFGKFRLIAGEYEFLNAMTDGNISSISLIGKGLNINFLDMNKTDALNIVESCR